MMHPQDPQKEGLILLTVTFLERGDVLKNGTTGVQKYELDLFVPDSITCDQLMGAIYVGIRDTLISRYHLDLSRRITDLAYRSTACEISEQANRRELRRDIIQGIQMRAYTAQNNRKLRKIAELDRKFGLPKLRTEMSSQEMEKMSWVVCWQVFHECFHRYCKGYPRDLHHVKMCYDRLAVIARSSPMVSGEGSGAAGKSLLWLNKASYGSQTLRRLGFVWGTKLVFDPILMSKDAALDTEQIFSAFRNGHVREAKPADTQTAVGSGDIFISAPPSENQVNHSLLPLLLLSPLITTGAVLCAWGLFGGTMDILTVIAMALAMVAATVFVSLINRGFWRQSDKVSQKILYEDYQEYIRRILQEIKTRQNQEIAYLNSHFLPVMDLSGGDSLLRQLSQPGAVFYERRSDDPGYLWIRMGTTGEGSRLSPSPFQITGADTPKVFSGIRYTNLDNTREQPFQILDKKADAVAQWGYLRELPGDIARKFAWMQGAPVGVGIRENRMLGLLLEDPALEPQILLEHMLLDLCFHHSPEDIQIVWFFQPTSVVQQQYDLTRCYRYLPHGRQLFPDRSQFVFNREDGQKVVSRLLNLIQQDHTPHILICMEQWEEYKLPEELTKSPKITIMYLTRSAQQLPAACDNVIRARKNGQWQMITMRQLWDDSPDLVRNSGFVMDPLRKESEELLFENAFRRLAIHSVKSADDRKRSAPLDYFRLLTEYAFDRGIQPPELVGGTPDANDFQKLFWRELELYVEGRWIVNKARGISSGTLVTPMGRGEKGIVSLDLHEFSHGPHLLLSGNDGSAVEAAAAGLMLSLCTHYPKSMVRFCLGGDEKSEMGTMLRKLPHHISANSNRSFDSLHGVMQFLNEQIRRRVEQLNLSGSSNLEEHHRAIQQLRQSIQKMAVLMPSKAEQDRDLLYDLRPMPHLVVMISFDIGSEEELDGHTLAEFQRMFDQAAQLSEGLGIHLLVLRKNASLPFESRIWDDSFAQLRNIRYDAGGLSGEFLARAEGVCHIQIADPMADVIYKPYEPFSIELASPSGEYRTFFSAFDYLPSNSVESPRKASALTIPRRDKAEAFADSGYAETPSPDPQYPFADHREVPEERRKPVQPGVPEQSFADKRPEEAVTPEKKPEPVIDPEWAADLADCVFCQMQNTGMSQGDMMVQVISRCAKIR